MRIYFVCSVRIFLFVACGLFYLQRADLFCSQCADLFICSVLIYFVHSVRIYLVCSVFYFVRCVTSCYMEEYYQERCVPYGLPYVMYCDLVFIFPMFLGISVHYYFTYIILLI